MSEFPGPALPRPTTFPARVATTALGGALVKHEKSRSGDPSGPPSGQGKHLWKAKYWTQGSEPGWTDQWQDLGRC